MRIIRVILVFLILSSTNIFAQKEEVDYPITIVEQMPLFDKDGSEGFILWVYQNLKYPESAVKDMESGKVFAKFKIDTLGTLKDVEIVKSARWYFDTEVKRVLNSSPKWTPGRQAGKNVGIYYTIPIEFDIKDQYFTKKIKFYSKHSFKSNKTKKSQ
jgi:TonB family protein